jgi:signal transduction histidine kinase
MKLFTQYNRITLGVLIGFFLLSSLVYYFLMRGLLFRELDLSLTKVEKRIEAYVRLHHAFPVVQQMDDLNIVYTPTGDPGGVSYFRLIPPAKGKNSDNIRELNFFMPLDKQWYRITVSRNLEGMKGTAIMVLNAATVTLLIVVAASLMVNRLVFRRLWKPFYTAIDAIGAFQLGRHNRLALPATRIEEFNFMNGHFTQMAARIDREYFVLKEFTENASHEMQTPLAIIRSKLDLAIQDQHLSREQSETLRSAYASVKKLTGLNRALLLIAKIGNHQYSESAIVDVKEKLHDKIVQFQELWKDRLEVSHDLHDAEIKANPDLVDILLNNLFSNASKHNIRDGKVMIRLSAGSLEIKNTGRPVPLDKTRMFRRFYKGAPEEDSNGLGLAIVKQIADLSGITIDYTFNGNIHGFLLQWNGPAGDN